jgi:hypothetical protein
LPKPVATASSTSKHNRAFRLFDPAPIAAARKFKPPALRVVLGSTKQSHFQFQVMAENSLAHPCFDSMFGLAPGFSTE